MKNIKYPIIFLLLLQVTTLTLTYKINNINNNNNNNDDDNNLSSTTIFAETTTIITTSMFPSSTTIKTTTNKPTTLSTTTTTTKQTTTNYPNNNDLTVNCPMNDNPTEITFLASNADCQKYYICYSGKPMPLECTTGMHWSPIEKKCEWPQVAQCHLYTEPTDATDVPKCPKSGHHFLPHPTVCDYFIFCDNGISSIQQCPTYYHWDIKEKRCLFRESALCLLDVITAAYPNLNK